METIKVGDFVEHPPDSWGKTESLVVVVDEDRKKVKVFSGATHSTTKDYEYYNVVTFDMKDCEKISNGGLSKRGYDAWKYQKVKKWIRRAEKFQMETKSKGEYDSWNKVIMWLKSLMKRGRYIDHGIIKLGD